MTINDVAKHAGVSIATVSRVINGVDSVNRELHEKVEKAIQALGYVPNSIAQSLKQNSSKMIGITASDISVTFFPEVIKGIEKAFLPKGYATIVSNTYDRPKNEKTILQHMVTRRVEALLVNSSGQNEDALAQFVANGTPVIFYDRRPRTHPFPAVYMDKHKSMYLALEHLMRAGHKRVMLATGPRYLTSNYDRYMGFQEYAFDHGIDPAVFSFRFGEFSYQDGMKAVEEALQSSSRPTAVVTGSISITAGIMGYCQEKGIAIPDDIAIVSSGNFLYGDVMGAKLTYLDDLALSMSDAVVQLLEKCLVGEEISPDYKMVLEPVLYVGASSGG